MKLETPNLIIRSWFQADIDPYATIIAKTTVMKYIGDGRTRTRDDAEHFIRNAITAEQQRGWILWAVEHRADRQLIGFCGFAEHEGQVEIGWRLDEAYWNHGYGTEAAQAVLPYGIATYHFPYIFSMAQLDNIGSIRIMQKIGLDFERFDTDKSCGRAIVIYSRHYPVEHLTAEPS